jgi:hypothetical protein
MHRALRRSTTRPVCLCLRMHSDAIRPPHSRAALSVRVRCRCGSPTFGCPEREGPVPLRQSDFWLPGSRGDMHSAAMRCKAFDRFLHLACEN